MTAAGGSGPTLSYSLSGDDASSFTIGEMGLIETAKVLSYEMGSSYPVTVTATDASCNASDCLDRRAVR